MLQTGMTPEQMAALAQNKGFSSASIANMLGKKHSFDRLMSLDFQSMQSIDNLANLIQRGMPSQASSGQMRNWDWNAPQVGMQNGQGGLAALGNLSSSMLSLHQNGMGPPQGLGSQGNAAFGNLLGGYNQNSLLQNLQLPQQQSQQGLSQLSQFQSTAGGQNQRLGNLLQCIGGANSGGNSFESLLQSVQNGNTNTGKCSRCVSNHCFS
jgi:hypothetical protein